ncbi:MAG: hypothetical protein ACTSWI_00230 [Alphaproteobacteria bacterium]
MALLAAFVVGSILGWIVYRLVDRSDYAFDQREVSEAIGRRFWGRDSLDAGRDLPPPGQLRLPPPQRTRAAVRFRARVRSSAGAAAWTEARDPNVVDPTDQIEPGSEPGRSQERSKAESPDPPPTKSAERPASQPVRATPRRPEPPLDDGHVEDPWPSALETWPVRKPVWPNVEANAPQLPDSAASGPSPALSQTPAHDDLWPEPVEPAAAKRVFGTKTDPSTPARTADPEIEAAATMLSTIDANRPPGIVGSPDNPDNLKLIKGIGPAFEKKLNRLGIYFFRQISAWTPEERDWMSRSLGAAGRIDKDDWVRQSTELSEPGTD